MNRFGVAVGVLIIVLGLLAGGSVLAYQAYNFLKTGNWPPVSMITALVWLDFTWAENPQDWLGAHKLLKHVPLSVALVVGSCCTGGAIITDES